jgi:hypothetical protein
VELGRDNRYGMEYDDYNDFEVNKMEKEGASSTGDILC